MRAKGIHLLPQGSTRGGATMPNALTGTMLYGMLSAVAVLVVCPSSALPKDSDCESEISRLERRIANLELRIQRLERKSRLCGQREKDKLSVEAADRWQDRIESVSWRGKAVRPVYQGVMAVEEKVLGQLSAWPDADGLAFHPDGRIAFSAGGGTVKNMQISYWSLAIDNFGPMAMSWDGTRFIRYDKKAKTLNQFLLRREDDKEPSAKR
jgi:hypothetical protein